MAQEDLSLPRPIWTNRRRIVYGTLLFCGGALVYLIGWAPSDELRETIANGLMLLAASVISAYVFGAVWDDRSWMQTYAQMRRGVGSGDYHRPIGSMEGFVHGQDR